MLHIIAPAKFWYSLRLAKIRRHAFDGGFPVIRISEIMHNYPNAKHMEAWLHSNLRHCSSCLGSGAVTCPGAIFVK